MLDKDGNTITRTQARKTKTGIVVYEKGDGLYWLLFPDDTYYYNCDCFQVGRVLYYYEKYHDFTKACKKVFRKPPAVLED